MKIKEKYNLAKEAKIGTVCKCPSCNTEFIKTNYQQAFCKSKGGTICKDKYWNTVTPNKKNNTTRISPASASWMAKQENYQQMRKRYTSEGYEIINGTAYNELGQPVYDVDKYEDDYEHGQWND